MMQPTLVTAQGHREPRETRRASALPRPPHFVISLTGRCLLAVLLCGGASSAWAETEQIPATDWEKELAELDVPEEKVPISKRLSVTLSGGTSACMKDGKAKCSKIDRAPA